MLTACIQALIWRADRVSGFAEDAARASTAEGELIREYCLLRTELVPTAEEELLDRDRRLEEGERERLRDGFDRLSRLQREIGRTGFAALRPLLPFSKNDEWELAELKELVGRFPGN